MDLLAGAGGGTGDCGAGATALAGSRDIGCTEGEGDGVRFSSFARATIVMESSEIVDVPACVCEGSRTGVDETTDDRRRVCVSAGAGVEGEEGVCACPRAGAAGVCVCTGAGAELTVTCGSVGVGAAGRAGVCVCTRDGADATEGVCVGAGADAARGVCACAGAGAEV